MPDSKIPDAQAGYESALPNLMSGLSGANLIYESSGMLASLLSCSFEAFVIDNEIVGSVLRAIRGIEITDETLSFDVIAQAVEGPGHFLGAEQTLTVMESEYLYPVLGNRATPAQWQEEGRKDMWQNARERVVQLMQNYPDYLSAEQDQAIRQRFGITPARFRDQYL